MRCRGERQGRRGTSLCGRSLSWRGCCAQCESTRKNWLGEARALQTEGPALLGQGRGHKAQGVCLQNRKQSQSSRFLERRVIPVTGQEQDTHPPSTQGGVQPSCRGVGEGGRDSGGSPRSLQTLPQALHGYPVVSTATPLAGAAARPEEHGCHRNKADCLGPVARGRG